MKKIWKLEFTRFIIVGVLNTICYYLVYLFFYQLADVHYLVSHWIGIIISMIFSFFLNSYFTYGVRPTWRKFFQFPLTQVVNITVSSVLVYIFIEGFGWNGTVAPVAAVFFTVPITFVITSKIMKNGRGDVTNEA
ncbi:Putative flippase GtrA (transmembrane translocase of bactoprenol-linked glucose) [Terribacillus halophilus]|uniref:Putative flippase GtrA (Transmembrane translocase of bactoprenol-linked glucose) n=1 Tax=Terribacillus halophilus TaxID=361279 RepID=A0A1G6RML3_9BACI|nr:GtrA family protein [Terribacillus halophilus]SDD05197.1 Putative flippase GtrA (transmembrane translocase of bactoprenol-linked glucose) [Terribacillus halophilus]